MRLRPSLLAVSALAGGILATAALPAAAQPVTGLYIGAGAGANWVQSPSHINIPGGSIPGGTLGLPAGVTQTDAGKAEFNIGWGVVASVGWGFGNGLRAEVEGNYRNNEIDQIKGFGRLSPFGDAGGWQRSYGVMANVFYDFDFANFGLGRSIFQPYIGVGVGYIWTTWRNIRTVSQSTGLSLSATGTEANFGYQAILGVATPFTWAGVPGLTATLEYRFLGTIEPEFNASFRTPTGTIVAGGKFQPQNFNHGVFLGLRYALFQPPPPPPPAPPPVVAPA
jgi:OmpA-OmpF porin, OOP family